MKEFKTFNQQLKILRDRGMIVPNDGRPKRFLEQENYYNVINGYKDLFLQRDENGALVSPEKYLPNTDFNELKALFLFDRDLRILFLKYILKFENSFKTVFAYEFSNKYREQNAYLNIKNYDDNNPKQVLNQINILTSTIYKKVDKEGAIKHYIENQHSVPLWVLVNELTIGNMSHLYGILKKEEKNIIAKFYSDKYNKQYSPEVPIRVTDADMSAALKIINLVRNKCAHHERLYNAYFKNIEVVDMADYYNLINYNNTKIVVVIIYLKVLLDKNCYKSFYRELKAILNKYESEFHTVSFSEVLSMMGIDPSDLEKLA